MSAPPSAPADASPASKPKRRGKKSLFILLTIILIGGGIAAWQVIIHRGLESTDNAQLEAEIVPVPARVGGLIVEVRVHENQHVQKDEILARIDDAQAKARLAQADAAVKAAEAAAAAAELDATVAGTNASGNLDVAQASRATAESAAQQAKTQLREADAAVRAAQAAYAQAKSDLDRDEELHKGGVVSDSTLSASRTRATVAASNVEAAKAHLGTLRASIDQAESKIGEAAARVEQTHDVDTLKAQAASRVAAAKAQVDVAKAARAVAQLDLDYTTIRAPQAGVLSKKSVSEGQMVSPGQPIAQLVTESMWVTANFKETQLADVRPGQKVKVEVDAFPGVELTGEVESLSGATGARFSLLPPDNASGNYTKVVQRVPVRVRLGKLPDGVPLRPGMSVGVVVDTRVTGPGTTATARVD
ncbi:MAG: HlyD family secretion protein [Myxococcota bacterium]